MADPGNRERGLKAALSNPRVSEQAKERDRKILVTEFGEHFEETPDDAAERDSLFLARSANPTCTACSFCSKRLVF